MTTTLWLSMASFALAASISPGPVNLVSLSNGIRRQLRTGLWFVTGAALGFTALFIAIGFGLHTLLQQFPLLNTVLRWAGIAFLLYLAFQLFISNGNLDLEEKKHQPGFFTGALMQWLNPKAWLASAAGISAYTANGDATLVWIFAALYAPICWLSIGCWLAAGSFLHRHVQQPNKLRWINRSLGLLLAASCGALLV